MNKLTDFLKSGVSAAAETIASMSLAKPKPTEPDFTITAKSGQRGQPYRRIIAQEALPVWFIQSGIRWDGLTAKPRLERIERHRFLHATKGFRTYRNGLPGPGRPGAHAPNIGQHAHGRKGRRVVLQFPPRQCEGAPWRTIARVMKGGTIVPIKQAA